MIDEEATFKKFGYYPSELKPQSNKGVIAICDDCGKARILSKCDYRTLCLSCSHKGAKNSHWKGGEVKRICEFCGIKFPVFPGAITNGGGRFCTHECKGKWMSKNQRGGNNPSWKGGISFEPYCVNFNNEFKEYIRDKFGRVCFLCPKTEEEEGRKLSVHHVNYNKGCGCDGDETCQFVPLCRSCNSKVNFNREMWEAKIKAKMRNKLNGWYI